MEKKQEKIRDTYFIRLPVIVIEEWENIRKQKGYEKCFMVTQAFRHYIDNVLMASELSSQSHSPQSQSQSAVRE